MSRLILSLVVLLVVIAVVLFVLASQAKERPVSRIEQPVEIGNLAG